MKISDTKLISTFKKALSLAKKQGIRFIAISSFLDSTLAIEMLKYAYNLKGDKYLMGYGVEFAKAEWKRLSNDQKEELYDIGHDVFFLHRKLPCSYELSLQ